ncbi:MAG: hypothetical protein HY819_14180 [Acidobacteria bacterium]|nr:hypothetical protein [Acidobacteriota bacterium]
MIRRKEFIPAYQIDGEIKGFLAAISDLMLHPKQDKTKLRYLHCYNNMLLHSPSEVCSAITEFNSSILSNLDSIGDEELKLNMVKLINVIRKWYKLNDDISSYFNPFISNSNTTENKTGF